jgi:hypothetical protein
MKTKYPGLAFKSGALLILALALGAKVNASVIDLTITEEDGNTILLTGPDAGSWTVTGSSDHWIATRSSILTGMVPGSAFNSWTEPDNPAEANNVAMSYSLPPTDQPGFIGLVMSIYSDAAPVQGITPATDGTPLEFVFFNANQQPIDYSVRYIDQGDSVPDRSPTALCLVLGLVPVLWLGHRRAKLIYQPAKSKSEQLMK